MFQLNKKLLIIIIACLALPALALAGDSPGFVNPLGDSNITVAKVLGNIITFLLGLVGLLGLIALIWGGLSYITALGDEKRATRAKTVIFWAIIGIAVAVLAYVIVQIVVTDFLGVSI